MPQLDPSSFFSQLFWLTVTFLILYFAMVKFALPALREVLQNRHDRITHDLEKAELARKEAEAAKAHYTAALEKARHTASALVVETMKKLEKENALRQAKLDKTLEVQMKEAEEKLSLLKKEAMQFVKPLATELAMQWSEKLVHSSYDKTLIATAIEKCEQSFKQQGA